MPLYAAYASNMDPAQMLQRAPHSPMSSTGWLHGWRLTFAGDDIGWEGSLATVTEDRECPDSKVFVVLYDVPAEDEDFGDDPADADVVAQIRELIETRVRPAVANDGGDIVYRGFREGVVFLTMQGACSGCPSSTATLKNGIEGLLKHYVPEVTAVEAV